MSVTRRILTPGRGRYRYAWLAVSPDGGKLGVGTYYRPTETSDWRVYGAIFNTWQKPALTSLDEANPVAPASTEAPGDLMGSYFNPDGTLGVVWTRDVQRLDGVATVARDINYARSR